MAENSKITPSLTGIQKSVSRVDFQAPNTNTNGSSNGGKDNGTGDNGTSNQDYRLAEVLAAVRRELEAVALIAEVSERDVPKFHLSSAEIDFTYGINSLTDEGGLRVAFTQDELQKVPSEQLHHLKVTLLDVDVLSAESDAKIALNTPK